MGIKEHEAHTDANDISISLVQRLEAMMRITVHCPVSPHEHRDLIQQRSWSVCQWMVRRKSIEDNGEDQGDIERDIAGE